MENIVLKYWLAFMSAAGSAQQHQDRVGAENIQKRDKGGGDPQISGVFHGKMYERHSNVLIIQDLTNPDRTGRVAKSKSSSKPEASLCHQHGRMCQTCKHVALHKWCVTEVQDASSLQVSEKSDRWHRNLAFSWSNVLRSIIVFNASFYADVWALQVLFDRIHPVMLRATGNDCGVGLHVTYEQLDFNLHLRFMWTIATGLLSSHLKKDFTHNVYFSYQEPTVGTLLARTT